MTDGTIQIDGLTKRFGSHTAVNAIDLDIPGGQFFSMLGPSGCGKTTTLRLIAGFEQPDAGRILLNGDDMAHTAPHKRPVNTVFQNYALFPHLNVFDNVAFGLRRSKLGKDEVKRRAGEALELVMLSDFGQRRPAELSGGQQQRVALARALVLKPAGLLLDEPLGALDAKLRRQLQVELKALQEQVGITFVYVTHDQDEALTMSDRLAVMANGRVEQLGTPHEIYEAPRTAFVADFLGASNLMDATVLGRTDRDRCRIDVGGVELTAEHGDPSLGGAVKATIRPERVRLQDPGPGTESDNRLAGTVERTVYLGSAVTVMVHLNNGCRIEAEIQNAGQEIPWRAGNAVHVHLPADALRVLAIDASAATDTPERKVAAQPDVPRATAARD